MRNMKTFLIITGITAFSFVTDGLFDSTFACRGCTHSGVMHVPVSPPPFYFPPPPGFPQDWLITDVVESIEERGLEMKNVKEAMESDYRSFPANPQEGVTFHLSSLEGTADGCIFSFQKKDDVKVVQRHFLELNEKGELYTWSFIKDNILLVLSGALPQGKARQYEQALYGLKE